MSLKEAEQIKPLRLKIVTVGPHDKVRNLARRMAVSDDKVKRFRVLNGLGPKDRVKPGDSVKLVVE
jgi:predicted Zn-dependent protease